MRKSEFLFTFPFEHIIACNCSWIVQVFEISKSCDPHQHFAADHGCTLFPYFISPCLFVGQHNIKEYVKSPLVLCVTIVIHLLCVEEIQTNRSHFIFEHVHKLAVCGFSLCAFYFLPPQKNFL